MSGRALALARRQQVLLARSAELRIHAATQLSVLRPPLDLADQFRSGWHWLRTHPEWPIGVAIMVVVLRPRRALRWGLRLWSGWRLLRRLQRRLAPVV
ncbi:MAG: YqjK-like family protein [Aquincola sp.]|nr:YqjK-like family protein [Aquincola sp.]MDH5329769.1 YqjK-like family protein [Aquincola sp.]